jgi:predicted phosphate transport protein (TIGR00153 family)
MGWRRKNIFVEQFTHLAAEINDGACLLNDIFRDYPSHLTERVQRLGMIEHTADEITHGIFSALNTTFITPFDRGDIHGLASSMDDVLDFVWTAGHMLVLYRVESVPECAGQLTSVIVAQCDQLNAAVQTLLKPHGVLQHCVEVSRLEREADDLARRAISRLLDQRTDPITLIKLKDVFSALESAADAAEDAANVLEAVALKSE